MNSNDNTAKIVGALFLTAMFTSLVGGGLLESIFNTHDYLINISENIIQITTGMLLELINAVAVFGIAIFMFTVLKQHAESIALVYVGFRIIETLFCIFSAIIPLLLIALSQHFIKAGISDASYFQTTASMLITVRAHLTGLLIPLFFCLGALLFYYQLYQTRLMPRWLSVWGLIGVILVFILNLLEPGIETGVFLALPIILNEIVLGIWLISKGFNSTAVISEPVK